MNRQNCQSFEPVLFLKERRLFLFDARAGLAGFVRLIKD